MSLLLRGEIRVVDNGVYNICIADSNDSLIVDANKSVVQAEYVHADTFGTTDITVNNKNVNDFSKISFLRKESFDLNDTDNIYAYGALRWARDDINGPATSVYMQGGNNGLKLFSLPDGHTYDSTHSLHFNMLGNLGVGKPDPVEKLDIEGNAQVSGFVQFGRLDTTARDSLAAANGMVIYNTTDDRFQGYQKGKWINLDDGSDA